MKKQNKKTNISIVRALNEVCESLKIETLGFSWLTHFADYANFPHSLKLVFVFDTNTQLESATGEATKSAISKLTDAALQREGISITRIDDFMFFDSEENGADVRSLRWCKKYT